MQLPISVSPSKKISLQQQLVDQFRELIAKRSLQAGDQIPSSREMAELLGLSRRTVVLAYERLLDEGVIETRPGHGSFISHQLPDAFVRVPTGDRNSTPDDPISTLAQLTVEHMDLYQPFSDRLKYDFRIGRPDPDLFPHNHWRRLATGSLDTFTKTVVDYTLPTGHQLLRESIAQHLRITRGIVCSPKQVIVTAGVQDGLNLVSRLMDIHGKDVIIEDPCYDGAAKVFKSLSAKLQPVPVNTCGIDTDSLPGAGGRIAYVTPSHQFPLGMTMSREPREALIAWARKTGTLIVEDDYDSDFRHNSTPIPAVCANGPDIVVYLGTFSKSIGPGLRLGYAVFPEHLADQAGALKSVMSNGHPWLEQSIMAQFISSGAFEIHLGRMRKNYLDRRNAVISGLADAFPDTTTSGYDGGMHLVWRTSDRFPPAIELQAEAKKLGVGIYSLAGGPVHQIVPHAEHDRVLLLGYACLTTDSIAAAIDVLDRMLSGVRYNSTE